MLLEQQLSWSVDLAANPGPAPTSSLFLEFMAFQEVDCLAVSVTRLLPYLIPAGRLFDVDDVYKPDRPHPLRGEWPDAVFAVWISKSVPEWWIAAEGVPVRVGRLSLSQLRKLRLMNRVTDNRG